MKRLIILTIITVVVVSQLKAQDQEPLADQMQERLKSEEFNVSLLLQSLGFVSFTDEEFNGGSRFDLGATRLVLGGTVDNNYIYKLQMDFRGQPSVLDAQVGYAFSRNFRVITGAFKPFLSIDLDPNPGATDIIGRARHVRSMTNSREIGITLLGDPGNFNYRVGMYNGTGLSRTNDGHFLYTLRLGYTSEQDDGFLTFGLNAALNQTELEQVGNTGLVSLEDRKLFGAFVQYDSPTLFGTAELLQTRFDAESFNDEETIIGFFATLGGHITEQSDLLVRWDHLGYDALDRSSELLVLGWNHQATRLIRFQVNVLARFEDSQDTQVGASGNFQFRF